jgi:hypothetical protein
MTNDVIYKYNFILKNFDVSFKNVRTEEFDIKGWI